MDSTLPFKIIHGLLAMGVIAGVLLQPGKGGGLSGAVGGGGSGSQGVMAKKKGREEKLARLTSAVAILFMVSAIILAFVVGR